MRGKEIRMNSEKDRGLELVVETLLKSEGGKEVLKYFVLDGMGASFTTDPIMNSYLEGRRLYGRKMLQILRRKHIEYIAEILGADTEN